MKLFAALITFAFVINASALNEVEKVIGQDQLLPVNAEASNIPPKFKKLVDAFGLMSMGCTATHIGKGYVLTAGHCFEADEELTQNQPCQDVSVQWGVREGKDAYLASKCEVVVAMQQDDVNDFAIFKVSPAPEAAAVVDLHRQIPMGYKVTIFSHPEELPLRWSKICTVIRDHKLDPGFSSDTLQHKCDTNPGSSGATIIDAYTAKVVAIHDGGHLTGHKRGTTQGMNYGTYITNPPVAEALKSLGF